MDKRAIMIFGVGELQKSIIEKAKHKELFVVGIDPCVNAICKEDVDAFEVVDGNDFQTTILIAKKYNISAIATAATDKPLVMMAKVAKQLGLPFYSEETALISTDKYLMKQKFQETGIPCSRGGLTTIDEEKGIIYPVIIKPRDNSGSRGVKFCENRINLRRAIIEASKYTHKSSVLMEEFIEGKEYSVESLHYNGKSHIIQFTEKKTTPFPYNVELGHIQPADLSELQKYKIHDIIDQIGKSFKFENCASHTELKINDRGIFIIETSPRLGGDYITSVLTPLSTGVNMEDELLNISLGEKININQKGNKSAGICFFSFPSGVVKNIDSEISDVINWEHIVDFKLAIQEGDTVRQITSSLNRYGHFIVKAKDKESLVRIITEYENKIRKMIFL